MTSRSLLIAAALAAGVAVPAAAAAGGLEVAGGVDRGSPASSAGIQSPSAFVPGEAIVRYEKGTAAAERRDARSSANVEFDRSAGLARAEVVEVEGGVKAAIARLERQPDVAYAQPNYRYHAFAPAPNDTFFGDLWGLEDPAVPDPGVNALSAWDTTRGAGQVIAVVDTGVDLDHPDLTPNLWTGPGGIHGADFVDGDDDPDDYNFHGTHVAGTAAAVAGNALGTAGVAPEAEIMAVRVLDGDGSGSSVDIGGGIAFAAQSGADVINLSLGGPAGAGDQFMSDAVALADQLDAVVVAAAGNDGSSNDAAPKAPCNLPQPNLICVAAVNRTGNLASFSNFGAVSVDVGAPGTSILSAKTDYASVFDESFDEDDLVAWDIFAAPGSIAWARTTDESSSGTHSATDSPGTGTEYLADSDSELFTAAPLDLSAERGCRVHVDLMYEIEPPDLDGSLFDFLFVGAVTNEEPFDGLPFAGESFGYDSGTFLEEEASISDLDGRDDVFPFLALFSDESIQADGAYADDLAVLCRDDSYVNSTAAAGNYVSFQGTSMASPHVAGVAALVGAADPGASDTQVVQAIKQGGAPLPALVGTTSTGRTASASGAIAAALGLPNSSGPPPTSPSPPPPTRPTAPAKPSLAGARRTIRVSRKRVFRYSFRASSGLTGSALFKTRKKAVVSRKAHVTVARKRFRVGSRGKVTLKLKVSKRNARILRRNGKLLLKVTVKVRNAAGLSSTTTKRLTLKPPKKR